MKDLKGSGQFTPGQTVTIYSVGGFGASTVHAKIKRIQDHSEGRKAVFAIVPPKRKEQPFYGKTLVVIDGTHAPAPDGLIPSDIGSKSRYLSFDPRYATDFNKWINALIRANNLADKVIVNQRETDDETDPVDDAVPATLGSGS